MLYKSATQVKHHSIAEAGTIILHFILPLLLSCLFTTHQETKMLRGEIALICMYEVFVNNKNSIMKNNLLSLVALSFTIAATAQNPKCWCSSGNIVTKNIAVQAFNAIEAAGIYELVLTQGDKEAVRIEADDNMQELLV